MLCFKARFIIMLMILSEAPLGYPQSLEAPRASNSAAKTDSQPSDAERILRRAIQLHRAGDFEGAIREYSAFLVRQPEGKAAVEARSNLGAALAHLGRYREAIEQYRQALQEDPQAAEAGEVRFNLAVAYYKSGRIPDAAGELSALQAGRSGLMANEARKLNITLLLADCDLRMGDDKKVVELLSPLEPGHRDDRALAYLLGTALIRDKQVARGQVIIDRILRHGDSAEARLLLGSAKLMVHDSPGAIQDLERAIELKPDLPSAHSIYGRALLEAGDRRRALEAFRRELEIDPNDFDSNLYLGVLLREDQAYENALRYLNRALEVRPGDPAARYQIGAVYLAQGQTDDAARELERVVKESPSFLEAHVSLATAYYRQKRKRDGDRERAIVARLNAEAQAQQTEVGRSPKSTDGIGGQAAAKRPD